MNALLLHPQDNVLVVIRPIAIGDPIAIDGAEHVARAAIGVGHKVARRALAPGDIVVKYGAPIGSMTAVAAPGDHIHLHNMKSDYIASHLRDTLERSAES
jgi:hypothetical protein